MNLKQIQESWLIEVQCRAREFDEGLVHPIPADEVKRKGQNLTKESSRG